jgi:hypothetical protein
MKETRKWLLGLCVALAIIIGNPLASMAAEDNAEATPKTSEDPYGAQPADAPAKEPCDWTIMRYGFGHDPERSGIVITEGNTVAVRASCDNRGEFQPDEGIRSPRQEWVPPAGGSRGIHEVLFSAPAYNEEGDNTHSYEFKWDGEDGRTETKTFTVKVKQASASKAEVEEVNERVDDIERSYGRTFWLTGGLLWGPNDNEQTGNAWGVELASAYRVIQPDPVVGMKLGFSLRDRWSSVRVNENVYATEEDVPEHITTLAGRVLLNLELAHWIDLDLGAELGGARFYRDQSVLAQYPNRRIELDKDYERWTPVIGGYGGVNFYPTKHLVLGLGVDADYNTRKVSRIAANDESGVAPVDDDAGERGFIATCHYFVGWTW